MAARIRRPHQEEVKAKIRASQLVNALQKHVLGGKSKLTASQVKAAEILLRKCVPDLSATTIGGDADNPLVVEHADAVEALLSRPSLAIGAPGSAGEDGPTIQ